MELREPCAIFLTEHVAELNMGAGFLNRLSDEEQEKVRALGTLHTYQKHDMLFSQGEKHAGIWIIESGRVRSFYTGPNGREITLAYWTKGHFVGGPEVFGEGRHVWSGDVLEQTQLLFLPGSAMRTLVTEVPSVAISVIEGLVAKGKCYSALIQMFGTRSATARLEHLLVILATHHGHEEDGIIVIDRTITYEQLATIVGATRQWVSTTLDNLQIKGILTLTRTQLRIASLASLREQLDLQSRG
ncbi:MAG: Crp/Fnr family transcriptional regulator [Granulosicoccus sp.]|nr:Crp/Fnr family transcriptional regulator [Granulosicoccus sp.]